MDDPTDRKHYCLRQSDTTQYYLLAELYDSKTPLVTKIRGRKFY